MLPALLLLVLLVPARAAARGSEPDRDPQVRSWLRAAASYWGTSPGCQGGVGVVRAEWSSDANAWAAAWPGGCWIALDPDYYPRPAAIERSLWSAAMCAVVAHEWGHLLGRAHSTDRRSIMAPAAPLDLVPGCRAQPAPSRRAIAGKRRR